MRKAKLKTKKIVSMTLMKYFKSEQNVNLMSHLIKHKMNKYSMIAIKILH